MRLFGLDINIQRRELAPGVPSSTMEGIKDNNNAQAGKAAGANYAERIVPAAVERVLIIWADKGIL